MAVAMINRNTTELDWDQVMQTSDGQELKSSHMEWIDREIFIVELPSREREHFGAGGALPAGMEWVGWHTLKVEVGFTRHWGNEPGQLDWKANEWATFPGVAYILCVALDKGLATASYKLYRTRVLWLPPNSNLEFDSRLLLGLQPGDALPAQFPDPLVVDLHEVLADARDEFPAPV
ncbi:hypothetical protein PHYSODRAFT_337585 [Phytophthora sojae]|uniref:Uncharacterized protein n=1 Tax=Phytophthora sojae (strain P6497) TaxID=1094619 RepID=G5A1L5_PHYSP|nr:hypothetical protein PHYSODRAFT_337585 [Phytophthora sojae]EGZ10813.1 hypothetical protein PHYSODRAFT_337585 [Phytophthora sojae]|eukprot:XP_009533558.1 hypothetical protein PHYSODRAFT_337585 [Phytophthora sojae]